MTSYMKICITQARALPSPVFPDVGIIVAISVIAKSLDRLVLRLLTQYIR